MEHLLAVTRQPSFFTLPDIGLTSVCSDQQQAHLSNPKHPPVQPPHPGDPPVQPPDPNPPPVKPPGPSEPPIKPPEPTEPPVEPPKTPPPVRAHKRLH